MSPNEEGRPAGGPEEPLSDAGSVPGGPGRGKPTDLATFPRLLFTSAGPGTVLEVRAVEVEDHGKRVDAGYFDDAEAMAAAAEAYDGRAKVYVTLNPVNPALRARARNRMVPWAKSTTQDADILRRLWLYLDLDPLRPAGIPSSDPEHQAAIERARFIADELAADGWSRPIVADSGNGTGLLWRANLPNDDASRDLVRAALAGLAGRFAGLLAAPPAVELDLKVFNAARVVRLYGTMNRKGDGTSDRPHRRSGLVEVPEDVLVLPMGRLIEACSWTTGGGSDGHGGERTSNGREDPWGEYARESKFSGEDLDRFMADGIPPGVCRHAALAAIAARWRVVHGMIEEEILHGLLGLFEQGKVPPGDRPISRKELEKIAVWASKRPPRARDGRQAGVTPAEPAAWGESEALDESGLLPPFPREALPGWAAAFVRAVAIAYQVAPELPALLVLGALAGAVQRRYVVRIAPDWAEPLAIYALVALPPATRKSAVVAAVMRPVVELEAELAERWRPTLRALAGERALYEAAASGIQSRARKAGVTPKLTADLEAALARVEEIGDPRPARLIADEATQEALGRLLAAHGGRLLVASAESELVGILAGRYRDTRAGPANLGILLAGHAGDTLRVDRVGRDPLHVVRPALSLALATQPELLRELLGIRGAAGRGLLGRLLVAVPPHGLGSRLVEPPPVPPAIAVEYESRMRTLWDGGHLAGPVEAASDAAAPPVELSLAPAAVRLLREFRAELEPGLADGGEWEDWRPWAGKAAGLAARLAGIVHLAEEQRGEVDASALAHGIALARWGLSAARHAMGALGVAPELVAARRVLARLRAGEPREEIPYQDLWRLVRGGPIRGTADLDAALVHMEARGWVRLMRVATLSRPRRVVGLHPAIWGMPAPTPPTETGETGETGGGGEPRESEEEKADGARAGKRRGPVSPDTPITTPAPAPGGTPSAVPPESEGKPDRGDGGRHPLSISPVDEDEFEEGEEAA